MYMSMLPSLLSRTHALPGAPRVRVRLGGRPDASAAAALLAGRGIAASDLELRRLFTYDPLRRAVLCAFAPIDGHETLVGLAAADLDGDAEPDTMITDENMAPGLATLLGRLLTERARARARRAA